MLYMTVFLIPSKINKIYSAICISKFDWKFCVKKGKNIYITYKDTKRNFLTLLFFAIDYSPNPSLFVIILCTSTNFCTTAPLLSKGVKLWLST